MSVTLISPPPTYAFCGDQIRAKFEISDIHTNLGEYAVNVLPLPTTNVVDTQFGLTYGGKSVVMTAKLSPDDSGFQFLASGIPVLPEVQLEYFKANYILSRDFDITLLGTDLVFTAKKKGNGYNMTSWNTVAGVAPVLKPNLAIRFILYCENADHSGYDVIYETPLSAYIGSGDTATAEAVINDKLHNHISAEIRNNLPDIPDTSPLICKKSCRKYYFEFAESYGDPIIIRKRFQSDVFTVLHGGLSTVGQATKTLPELLAPSTIDKDRFLKQGFGLTKTKPDQPQYLYYFNTREYTALTMVVVYYFTDGSIATDYLQEFEAFQFQKIAYNVQFDKIYVPEDHPVKTVKKYEIYLADLSTDRVTDSWWYELDYSYKEYYRYFLNWSSWGSMDSRMLYGKGSVEFELVQSEAEKSNINPLAIESGTSLVFNKSLQTKYGITTGWIKERSNLLFNRDLFLSAFIWVINQGNMLPIKITSKTIEEIQDGQNLYAQKFEYQPLHKDTAYTEGDIYKPVEPPSRVIGQVYFGAAASRPVTEADILALPYSQSPEIYLMPLYTGTNRIFALAVPFGKALGNAYDQTVDENVTTEYILEGTVVVDAINYHLYIMEMAIPYSINHDHIITIINE